MHTCQDEQQQAFFETGALDMSPKILEKGERER